MSHSSAGGRPLDLATCNNPRGWPVPPLPDEVWRLAPDDDDGLELDAVRYYENANLLPVAGRHAAINLLPHLFPPAMVACIGPLEDEHALAWKAAGHRPRLLQGATLARAVGAATPFVLLANPNPITGSHLLREHLLDAASQLGKRGGWLIVDETLADPLPDPSVAPFAGTAGGPTTPGRRQRLTCRVNAPRQIGRPTAWRRGVRSSGTACRAPIRCAHCT